MNLSETSEFINDLQFDLIAEFIVSCLIDEEITQEKIWVVNDGVLKRKWGKDISTTEIENFDYDKDVLTLHLNRAGIYNSLPESMFHNFESKKNTSGKEMAKESMRLKIEEKKIRLFFKPFENELFFQKVRLATKESEIYADIYFDHIHGLIPDFWKIDNKIPKKYILKLIKLLPFAYRIIGDYKLTAQSLEYIIDEDVKIKFENEEIKLNEPNNKVHGFVLGNNSLGYNSIIGDNITGSIGRLIFMFGPLKTTDVKDFYGDGLVLGLLKCFFDYFIPVEYDVEIRLILPEEQNKFILHSDNEQYTANSYLGYNIVL